MRSITLILTLTSLLFASDLLSAGPEGDFAEIDALFADMDSTEQPGCALGVIRDGDFLYRQGFGMANLEHGIPLSADSVFRIASTSKQFTAAAVALLAQQGKLGLDDSLRAHFPEFPGWADEVSIRQLIHHSSGIRDYLQLTWLAGWVNEADYYSDDFVLALLARQQETNFPPGSRYLYSNSGYLLLAHLVQRISGQSLKDYAQEQMFGPLGMTHTHFHNDHTHIVPNRAAGYAPTENGNGYRISMTTLDMIGDGGVYTSINDLLLWDRNFYSNRLDGGETFIQQLTTPGRFNDGTAQDYAFGLSVEPYRDLPSVHHGGAFVGFRAQMLRFPEQQFSVAVLCNRADADPSQLAYAVSDALLADALEPLPTAANESSADTYPLIADQLALFAGHFWNAEEGFAAETAVDDGKLWAVHSPDRRNELKPTGKNRFNMLGLGADVVIDFERDGERIVRMSRTINGQPRGEFVPFQPRQLSAVELDAYAGIYRSDELQVQYRLYTDQGRLMLVLNRVEPMELTPMFGETFENPDWGSFEFIRTANGSVTGFRLQSGRVRNLLFNRIE